jgi:hypothetical protein
LLQRLGIALCGGDEFDATVTMFVVIPSHKSKHPLPGLLNTYKGFLGLTCVGGDALHAHVCLLNHLVWLASAEWFGKKAQQVTGCVA